MSDDELDFSLGSVFEEPPRPPSPEATIALYTRETSSTADDWTEIQLRLVGSHPLWGNYLWNAARSFATFLDKNRELCVDQCILELGAAGALPSIVAAKLGAKLVVVTDYPDASLVDNMSYNVELNEAGSNTSVQGYLWGKSVANLVAVLPVPEKRFDLLILSDLIFNHSQHEAMLDTCNLALAGTQFPPHPSSPTPFDGPKPWITPTPTPVVSEPSTSGSEPCVLVFYTHHRPRFAHRDLEFFEKAREQGWICDEIVTEKFPPMFPEDPGEEEIRSTVHGWKMVRPRS